MSQKYRHGNEQKRRGKMCANASWKWIVPGHLKRALKLKHFLQESKYNRANACAPTAVPVFKRRHYLNSQSKFEVT